MQINLLHQHLPIINFSPGPWNWFSQERRFFNLWICLEGMGVLTLNDSDMEVYPGMALLIAPGDQVRGRKTDPRLLRNVGMHFTLDSEEDEIALIPHCSRSTHLQSFPLVRELSVYMDYLLFQVREDTRAEVDRLGADLLGIFLRNLAQGPEKATDQRIRKQADAMRAHPEKLRSGADLAAEAGLSLSQYSRRFYHLFNATPHDFQILQRIEKARNLLAESQMRVSEISEALGYRDLGFFSRQFKQKTGFSPLALRKQLILQRISK
jgi:AraC family transcriptional regulator, arabinose operon regulatory protein